MRSVLVTLALAAAVVTAAPQQTQRKERQVVVTNSNNYPSVLYINSAAGRARSTTTNSSNSPIFELILYPANPDPPTPKSAVVVLGGGEATGTITLTQDAPPTGAVRIEGTISNLTPGLHGFHIHEKGSLELGCVSAGGHYNPFMRDHGSPQNIERHVGDLGNILADETGTAVVNITDPLVTLVGPRSVVGRALVVHADEDDLGLGGHHSSLTTGNAGGRVGATKVSTHIPAPTSTHLPALLPATNTLVWVILHLPRGPLTAKRTFCLFPCSLYHPLPACPAILHFHLPCSGTKFSQDKTGVPNQWYTDFSKRHTSPTTTTISHPPYLCLPQEDSSTTTLVTTSLDNTRKSMIF